MRVEKAHESIDITAFSNPLTPKNDEPLISPYNITPESLIRVMRIKEMITSFRSFR